MSRGWDPSKDYWRLSEEVPSVQGANENLKPKGEKLTLRTCKCVNSDMDTHRVLIQTLPATLGDRNEPT